MVVVLVDVFDGSTPVDDDDEDDEEEEDVLLWLLD